MPPAFGTHHINDGGGLSLGGDHQRAQHEGLKYVRRGERLCRDLSSAVPNNRSVPRRPC